MIKINKNKIKFVKKNSSLENQKNLVPGDRFFSPHPRAGVKTGARVR